MSKFQIEGSKLDGRYYNNDGIVPAVGDYFEDGGTVVKVTKRKVVAYGRNVIITCKDVKKD